MTHGDGLPDEVGMPRAREDVVFRPLAREWVLYDPTSRQLHVLNVTAALVWSHCDGSHDLSALVEAVRESLTGAPEAPVVERDVLGALDTFAKENLLR